MKDPGGGGYFKDYSRAGDGLPFLFLVEVLHRGSRAVKFSQ